MSTKPVEPIVLDYAPMQRRTRRVPWVAMILATTSAIVAGFLAATSTPPPGGDRIAIARAVVGPNGTLSQAVMMYKTDVGHYPGSLASLMTEPVALRGSGRWRGPYLEDSIGLIDPWGRPYRYCVPGVHTTSDFDLWSLGRDGLDDTEDDILGGRRSVIAGAR